MVQPMDCQSYFHSPLPNLLQLGNSCDPMKFPTMDCFPVLLSNEKRWILTAKTHNSRQICDRLCWGLSPGKKNTRVWPKAREEICLKENLQRLKYFVVSLASAQVMQEKLMQNWIFKGTSMTMCFDFFSPPKWKYTGKRLVKHKRIFCLVLLTVCWGHFPPVFVTWWEVIDSPFPFFLLFSAFETWDTLLVVLVRNTFEIQVRGNWGGDAISPP